MAIEHTFYDQCQPYAVRPMPNRLGYHGEARYPNIRLAADHAMHLARECGVGAVIVNVLENRIVGRSHVPPRSRKEV